jgi:hypothetical protein
MILYLNIGLKVGNSIVSTGRPSKLVGAAMHFAFDNFGGIYSCSIIPGVHEPTLSLAVPCPGEQWEDVVYDMSVYLQQDCIACYTHEDGGMLIGPNVGNQTFDPAKFITEQIYWCMIQ